LNIALIFIYFLLVTLPHEWLGLQITSIFESYSRAEYNKTVLLIGVAFLVVYLFFLQRNIQNLEKKLLPVLYIILTIVLAVLSLNVLIIVTVEVIHFIQYAILAILIFPLIKRFFPTLLFVLFAGALDEAYQYFYLAPERTFYYDFNDVILDTIGGAFGLTFLLSFNRISHFYKREAWMNKIRTWGLWVFSLAMSFLLVILNVIQVYPNENGPNKFFTLVKKIPESFWTKDPHGIFHVVMPLEGLTILSFLLIFYSFLNYGIQKNNS